MQCLVFYNFSKISAAIMKKYHQLLIVSLGVLSFISFLIYKHEYDRLRNVLEVLEVFGSPPPPHRDPEHPQKMVLEQPDSSNINNAKQLHQNDQELKNSGEIFDPQPSSKDKAFVKKQPLLFADFDDKT